MIGKCLSSGFERPLSDQTATRSLGKFGDMVNIYCGECERFHMAVVKGSSQYETDW